MRNIPCVSLEMAERLKEAGYPPPDKKSRYLSGEWAYYENDPKHPHPGGLFKDDSDIYAPTATELLPKGYHLSHMSTREGGSVWAAFFDDKGGHCGFNENPHDAAALAWLWEKESGE